MSDGYEAEFKCRCGVHKFTVRYRDANEDIVHWLKTAVEPGMAEAHQKASPLCRATTADLKLPMPPGTAGGLVGTRVVN